MRSILELALLLTLLIALGVSYRDVEPCSTDLCSEAAHETEQFASVERGDICVALILALDGRDCLTDVECECLHGAGMEAED